MRTIDLSDIDMVNIHVNSLRSYFLETMVMLCRYRWNDFGMSDSGRVLIEAMLFNYSNLAYKCLLPINDLLTPKNQSVDGGVISESYSPQKMLTTPPLSKNDYRKAMLDYRTSNDIYGYFLFRNIEIIGPPSSLAVYYEPDEAATSQEINNALTNLKSKYPVLAGLSMKGVTPVNASIVLNVEVNGYTTDVDKLAANIVMIVSDYFSPWPRRAAPDENEYDVETLMEGPMIKNGWIYQLPPNEDYSESRIVNISGLIPLLVLIPDVIDVTQCKFSTGSIFSTSDALKRLIIRSFSSDSFAWLSLTCGGKDMPFNQKNVINHLISAYQSSWKPDSSHPEPYGKYRHIDHYKSASDRLPECYSLKTNTINEDNQQLHQFMLTFEQFLSNETDMIARLPEMLNFDYIKSTNPKYWGAMWPFSDTSPQQSVHQHYQQRLQNWNEQQAEDPSKAASLRYFLNQCISR